MQNQTSDSPIVKKRMDYLDMLKCLGMFIVVSGHIHPYYGWFSLSVHCFVIPLYFFLSGMTFKRSKFPTLWDFIKHRAKTLLLPYLMFSVVTWIFWAAFRVATHSQVDIWGPLLQTLISQGSGGFLVHNVPLWFLPCLFVIEVIYYIIDKLPEWANITACIVLSILGACMISVWRGVFVILPFSISLMISLTLVMINTAHWNGHISLGSDSLGNCPPIFYLNAFMGIVTSGIFAILICSLKRTNKLWNSIMDYHLWYGRNSLYIMATHVPVKGLIIFAIARMIGESTVYVAKDWWCIAIVFALTCAICSLLSLLIVKWKKRDELFIQNITKK